MHAGRHQIVTRAFRAGGGEDRRLELEEAALAHAAAERIDDRAALHDVGVQLVTAKIEEAILEPRLLRVVLVAEDRHRQFAGGAENLDVVDIDLHRSGGQVGILGSRRARAHAAVDADHPFRAGEVSGLERLRIGIDHALGATVMVAQIDEEHAAMIADAMAPAGKANGLADVGRAERPAGMGTITVHDGLFRLSGAPFTRGRASQGEGDPTPRGGARRRQRGRARNGHRRGPGNEGRTFRKRG